MMDDLKIKDRNVGEAELTTISRHIYRQTPKIDYKLKGYNFFNLWAVKAIEDTLHKS